jgi:DnaK suppressor protein
MPLTTEEVARFKQRLEELKVQMTHLVRGVSSDVTEPGDSKGYSQHQADEGTDDFVKTVNVQVSSTEFDIIRSIDRALEKIQENTYGICDISGEEIPIARLEAVPYAIMTVKSQEKLEKGLL